MDIQALAFENVKQYYTYGNQLHLVSRETQLYLVNLAWHELEALQPGFPNLVTQYPCDYCKHLK